MTGWIQDNSIQIAVINKYWETRYENTIPIYISSNPAAFSLSACLTQPGATGLEQGRVMVSEEMLICGAIVGEQAEQRINQEWSKYPQAEASRPVIEAVAASLLNNPATAEAQQISQYKKYLSCATGLLVANGYAK